MKKATHTLSMLLLAAAVPADPLTGANADHTITLSIHNGSSYRVTAVSDPAIATLNTTDEPEWSLEIGRRYRVSNPASAAHPFGVIARSATPAEDVFLLAQGAAAGTAEADPGVAWFTSGSDVYFTLSPQLADLMMAGLGGGYRCAAHSTMRGELTFRPQQSAFAWDGNELEDAEEFENAYVGQPLTAAFADWTVTTGNAAAFLTRIGNQPVAAPGQVAGSTRWLTITDSSSSAAPERVQSNAVAVPADVTLAEYFWSFEMNVTQTAAGTVALPGVQHFNANTSTWEDVWGIEVTDTSVNLVVLGTESGAQGVNGATLRQKLYDFSEPGFGKGNWVNVVLQGVPSHGHFVAQVSLPNGDSRIQEIMPAGGAFLPGISPKNFRFSISGGGVGNTSTISYDNVMLLTAVQLPAAAEDWQGYH